MSVSTKTTVNNIWEFQRQFADALMDLNAYDSNYWACGSTYTGFIRDNVNWVRFYVAIPDIFPIEEIVELPVVCFETDRVWQKHLADAIAKVRINSDKYIEMKKLRAIEDEKRKLKMTPWYNRIFK